MSNGEESVTFLGKGTKLEGKLRFEGTIRVDGHYVGEISSDGDLIVGEEGVLEADIRVGHVVINGEVRGNIQASQKVEIHAPGKVFGDISSPSLVIDDGAFFQGKTEMYHSSGAEKEDSGA
jgi:cytoskeletal protein CcmA (bactofilin family)